VLPLETRADLDGPLNGVQLVTTPDVGAGTARVGGYVTWASWHVQASGGLLAYCVGLEVRVRDGRPVCTRVTLDQVDDDVPVTAVGMRLPLERLVRESAQTLLAPADDDGHALTLALVEWSGPAGQRQAWAATEPRRRRRRAPGAALDDERRALLRTVRDAHATAALTADPSSPYEPVEQAAKRLLMSRSVFYRLLREAKAADAAGLLHDSETSDDTAVVPRKTRRRKP
jgi:hypothetical protein